MFTYTKTAGDVINSVIQDGQVQTTNRTALLDYVNRVSNRLLRESKWIFLRSPEYRFITQPDVEKYWVGNGAPPAGCVDTGLGLSDIYGLLGDSVFDLTNMRVLNQDADRTFVGYGFREQDGQFRSSIPRAFRYDANTYGVIHLFPPPDGQNTYQPLPSSPVCNWTSGGSLGRRTYWIKVTLVDSMGGESLPCAEPSNIIVPASHLLTVDSPTVEVASASTVTYPYFNIYISTTAGGDYQLVTPSPIAQGTKWTEGTAGALTLTPPLTIRVNDDSENVYTLGVNSLGELVTTNQGTNQALPDTYLADSNGTTWLLLVNASGNITSLQESSIRAPRLILGDGTGTNWLVGIQTDGRLYTQAITVSNPILAPTVSTIEPLDGYVIAFKYQKNKIQITDATDALQIPDEYFDVVVAGVNYYANLYTAKPDDLNAKAGVWKREFMEGLTQMRRDLRENFRNSDFLAPDPQTQYKPMMGYAYYIV